jgi:site-specific DNA recombinase
MRRPARAIPAETRTTTRCAVYTRKSSEEGLEQAFNSLDAQREACEAYILSQKHEGWTCLPALYDDGGISGATMERPALKRLMADIEGDKVDAVVVYKVDRLTRSLGDFAKIVEVFDRRNVSFVSVTQQFNTTTSMGRLTLNMLLSFAQFEREVTGERIRDKIAASKRKGMWMGGNVPLGYDAKDRKLLVNEKEASTVRHIYRRYAALGSVHDLKDELDRDGIVSKVRIDGHGRTTGGKRIERGALYLMLQNPIYRGQIAHKGSCHPGEHEAIVDEALWNEVQGILAGNRVDRISGAHAAEPSLLAGMLYDDAGIRMIPSHANKRGTRYRYYVSQGLVRGPKSAATQGRRVPAADLEALVGQRVCQFLASGSEVFQAFEPFVPDAVERAALVAHAGELARRWSEATTPDRRTTLQAIVDRIVLKPESLEIGILPHRLPAVLQGMPVPLQGVASSTHERQPTLVLTLPARLRRVGIEMRMLVEGSDASQRPKADRSLHRLLAQAHRYQALVLRSDGASMKDLAASTGVGGSYFTRVLKLSFLAPDIVKAILDDRHPLDLTAKRLANDVTIPAAWDAQRALLGFASPRA